MRFREVKRFIGSTFEQTQHWLVTELNSVLRELYIGLRALTFNENFLCFEWEGEILAGEEVRIIHTLGATPSRFQIISAEGNCLLVKGDTSPSSTEFYIKNVATTSTFTGRVIIFP